MKRYISPKITRVKLDPDQAVMASCKAGGLYMGAPSTAAAYCVYGGGIGLGCDFTRKGAVTAGGTAASRQDTESFPS